MLIGRSLIGEGLGKEKKTLLQEVRGGDCFELDGSLWMSLEQYDDDGALAIVRLKDGKVHKTDEACVCVLPIYATLAQ